MSKFGFEIKTSKDFYEKLLQDYEEFCKDTTSSRVAMNCAMTAWHLSEWVYHEYKAQFYSGYLSEKDFQSHIIENECPSLGVMKDIANGAKHHTLISRPKSVDHTTSYKGSFSNAFSGAFDTSSLNVITKKGEELYFEDQLKICIDFWREYFISKLGGFDNEETDPL